MKTMVRFAIISLCSVIVSTGLIAQEEQQQRIFIKTDYMKVRPGNTSAYIDLEMNDWKAVHEERVKSGNIVRWILYRIHFPSGTGAEYTYATTTAYDDFGKIDAEWFDEVMASLGKDEEGINKFIDKTVKARSLVKSEIWSEVEVIDSVEPGKYLAVDYMQVAPGQGREYVTLEREVFKPIHQANVEAGNKLAWGLYYLRFPSGSNQPYNFATVNVYKDYASIIDRSNRVGRREVHSDKDDEWWDKTWQKMTESRDAVSRQIWEIIAVVDAETMSAGN